jgi:hypothetical protein
MPSSIPDIVAWVGLDWADQQHEGRLQAVGSSQVESFVLPQRPEALQAWVGQLRTASLSAAWPWPWSSRAARWSMP